MTTTTAEDLAWTAWMDEQEGIAEAAEQRRFEDWKANMLADGYEGEELGYEDYSDYLEGFFPED